MKILILGAGAVGGYFGGRIAETGADVTFLVRPKRRAQLQSEGLRVESSLGGLQVPVKTVTAEELRPGYDVVLFTCKVYDIDSAMEAIAPAMNGTCAVVPMLNGISHFDRLDARFGRPQVVGGTCQVNATLRADGVVVHDGTLQRIIIGERDRTTSPRTEALAAVLGRTSLDWTLSADIEQDIWEKMVLLSALAAMTCLFRGTVAEIIAAPGGLEAMTRTLATNIDIVAREGHPIRPATEAVVRGRLTDPAGTLSASMLRDMEAGNPVEADHIVGWMLEKARAHGLDDSMLSIAYTHLKTYEARRAAGRLPQPRSS